MRTKTARFEIQVTNDLLYQFDPRNHSTVFPVFFRNTTISFSIKNSPQGMSNNSDR